MSIFEYDKELEERKLRKAEYEAGVADGIKTATENIKREDALALASRNMSYAEISEILNVPVKSVLSWINSQKQNLMMPGSKGLNPHELAHRWMKDLGTRPDMEQNIQWMFVLLRPKRSVDIKVG